MGTPEKKDVPKASALEEGNSKPGTNHLKELLEEEEEDVALDELEAMTIAEALTKKHGPSPVDCKWSGWLEDEECSKTCGRGGKKRQKRRIVTKKVKHGKPCE